MSIDALLVLVEQYKEAAQLIETAQAEQEALKAINQGRTCRAVYQLSGSRLP